MADQREIELGRLAVERKLVTQEQVLSALRARNADPAGPDLGERLVAGGHLGAAALAALKAAVARGERPRPRSEASTDHMIPLGNTREAIARECLREAEAEVARDLASAIRELQRLAEDFSDTESGVRARERLAELGAGE
ncbi:MAG: hypothetical protein AB7N76_14235 [Planctomycetota bacterium]